MSAAELTASVRIGELMDAGELLRVRRRRQVEVDEARSGHFHLRDERVGGERRHDGLCQLARVAPCRLRKTQRDVAGEIAMLRVARTLDDDGGRGRGFGQEISRKRVDRGQQ